jgi:hypothetical protein
MKKIQYFALAALTMLVFGCSNNKEFVPVFRGNIDGGDWINSNTIGNFGGHTGDHCSKVDSVNQYSYGFSKFFNEISLNSIKRVKISVWVKLEDLNKKTSLIISISGKDNKSIFWTGHELNSVVKETNKWYKLEVEDVLPEFDREGAHIETYIWNTNKNIAYVDDFEIRFVEE